MLLIQQEPLMMYRRHLLMALRIGSLLIIFLSEHLSAKLVTCRCPRQLEHSVTNEIIVMPTLSPRDGRMCHHDKLITKPVVYEEIRKSANQTIYISVCFPQDATNISGTFNGKIRRLQSNNTDVVTCSCRTEIDSFQCVPSTDIRRYYIQFTVASSNRAEILALLQYSIFNKTFISTIKRGEILRRFHNDKKSSHRKHLRRRIRETSREYRSTHLDITHISACGVTRSCFRYGDSADCGHMTCKFFVSIASDVTNENFDVELSGITDGWIGIGFSSDKIMGGEDDIISCQKFHKDRVEIMSYVSRTRHSRPERLEPHYLNLTSSKSSDAYIYCRFVLPFSRPHVNGRRYLDPTNDWYQMYARGPLTMDGMLGKHSEQPLVSAHKVSFLKSMNIYTSGGSSFLRHVSYFAQILLISLLWCL